MYKRQGVQKEQLASFQKGGEIPLSTKYTLAAQISRLSNMICPFDETMQALDVYKRQVYKILEYRFPPPLSMVFIR